jgi:hypothetical protein
MFAVEIYAAVRKFIFIEGNSRREAARVFGLSRDTIAKMCRYSAPPGYVRSKPPERPATEFCLGIAGHSLKGRVRRDVASVQADHVDANGDAFEQLAPTILTHGLCGSSGSLQSSARRSQGPSSPRWRAREPTR